MTDLQEQLDAPHVRIMASAGSGKTFQLANRYLRLARRGADPSTILASTFTRAAAGEIRDRILSVLAKAAMDETERSKLATHIGGPIDANEALDLLERMTRQLHRLQIRTLDSFFAAIVRSFPFELGIDPAAEIVDEAEAQALRQEAIRLMLDEADPQPMIELLRVLTEGSAGRRVTETIDEAVKGLYEMYCEAPLHAWEAIRRFAPLSEREYDTAVDAVRSLQDLLDATCDEKGAFFNHKSIQKAFAGDVAFLSAVPRTDFNQWFDFLSSGIAAKIAEGERSFYKRDIPWEIEDAYQPLVDHARALCRNTVVHRTQSTRTLLERFDARYRELKAKRKAMTFADLTDALLTGEAHDQLAVPELIEVYYRLDATLHHLLLDEMQDTSISQWRVLRPIVEEIISHATGERTSFAVGDVKQSIYGWREACPEILESLDGLLVDPETSDSAITSTTLDRSYRSSPEIMDVVNRVFTDTQSNKALEKYPEGAAHWDRTFKTHETEYESRPGYVELRIAREADDDEGRNEPRLIEAADLVAELHKQSPQRTIGVLMRRNADVGRLLFELGKEERNVPATAVGGGALTDAAPVNAILDLLRVADHPQHMIAAYNVMHSPLGPAVGLTHSHDAKPSIANCRAAGERIRRQLLQHGYAATIHEWIDAIRNAVDERELHRLIQLEELAAQYDASATLRCDDFVDFVENASVDDPGSARVQVMTVHQSKGLQFDTVVLPELEQPLSSIQRLKVIADRDESAGPIARIARHVSRPVWEMFDDLRGMLTRYENRQAREGLSLLYVAMTRAKYALHMIISPPRQNERTFPSTYAGVLRDALLDEAPEPGSIAYTLGDPKWHEHVPPPEEADDAVCRAGKRDVDSPRIELLRARGTIPRGRRGRAASEEAHEAAPLADRLTTQHNEARDRGTALHALFEEIEWIEDFSPDRDALQAIALRCAPRRGQAWAVAICNEFLTMLERNEVRTALARGDRSANSLDLRREFPFARLVDSTVRSGIIDRLVIERDAESPPQRAMILDFKTDQIETAELQSRAEQYRPQMETYRGAVAEIFSIDTSHVEVCLLFVALGWPVLVSAAGPAAHDP